MTTKKIAKADKRKASAGDRRRAEPCRKGAEGSWQTAHTAQVSSFSIRETKRPFEK